MPEQNDYLRYITIPFHQFRNHFSYALLRYALQKNELFASVGIKIPQISIKDLGIRKCVFEALHLTKMSTNIFPREIFEKNDNTIINIKIAT